jgi:hypothetical protein
MIPKIIHFVYGLDENFGGKPFGFVHWVAIRTAAKFNPSYKILFWCKFIPNTIYFDDLKDIIEIKNIEPPTEIHGRPLVHFAHKADVIRLQVLRDYGGVYLDLDTITRKPFDEYLTKKVVMGREECKGRLLGLCNAVIFAQPNSEFIERWLDSYRNFRSNGRDQHWNEHSVIIPMNLAEQNPHEISIFDKEYFFFPDWSEDGLRALYLEDKTFDKAVVHHLWESLAWNILKRINERNVSLLRTSYSKMVVETLNEEILRLRLRRESEIQSRLGYGGVKLNLGSGPNGEADSFVTCDLHEESGADLIFDLTKENWPIPSNCTKEVRLHHVLEHLVDCKVFFQELYRVCKNGAVIDVRVPHPRHDWFLTDPTHVKAWMLESFDFLDKEKSISWFFDGDAKTPLALYWNIDFYREAATYVLADNKAVEHYSSLIGKEKGLEYATRHLSNVIGEVRVQLRVRKD